MSTSMDFASVIVTCTPKSPGLAPIVFKASSFFNEEEFLSEPQPDRDRARPFMSNDGRTGQYIDNFAKAGKRDLTIFDGPEADKLQGWAYLNPQPLFDLSFRYQRNSQDESEVRTHFHTDCKILNHPARAMSNDIAVKKFNFHYMQLAILDEAGNPVA